MERGNLLLPALLVSSVVARIGCLPYAQQYKRTPCKVIYGKGNRVNEWMNDWTWSSAAKWILLSIRGICFVSGRKSAVKVTHTPVGAQTDECRVQLLVLRTPSGYWTFGAWNRRWVRLSTTLNPVTMHLLAWNIQTVRNWILSFILNPSSPLSSSLSL